MASSTRNVGTRSKSTSAKAVSEKVSCTFCNSKVDDLTPALKCDNCENWVCLACSKVPLSMYQELSKCDEELSLDWNCKTCKSTKADLKGIHKTLLEMKHDNDTRLKKVEDKLEVLSGSIKTTVREEVDKVKEGISDSITENIASKVKEIVQAQVKEIDERKNRSNNIIIFKLPLCTAKEPKARKEHDTAQLKTLFSNLCPDQGELEIKTCFRLFNKKTQAEKAGTPPLKVVLQSKEQRRNLLLQSKNIPDITDEDLKSCIIARDLTQEQRKESAALQKEKKDRTERGESVVIRNGAVVTVPPNQRGHSP